MLSSSCAGAGDNGRGNKCSEEDVVGRHSGVEEREESARNDGPDAFGGLLPANGVLQVGYEPFGDPRQRAVVKVIAAGGLGRRRGDGLHESPGAGMALCDDLRDLLGDAGHLHELRHPSETHPVLRVLRQCLAPRAGDLEARGDAPPPALSDRLGALREVGRGLFGVFDLDGSRAEADEGVGLCVDEPLRPRLLQRARCGRLASDQHEQHPQAGTEWPRR
mmetsp:Transcript_114280/g.328298  ORF Transcript_114280/g.328298 Transcript_114280/m.328298 type:complete len:220 (+) Transcript_114280:191-850(+)